MQQLKCTCGICRTCYKREWFKGFRQKRGDALREYKRAWQEQWRRNNGMQPLYTTGLDKATYKTEWNRKRRQDPEYRLKEKLNAIHRNIV